MQSRKPTYISPEIGTAWLLLSHAPWLMGSVTCLALATSFLVFFEADTAFRAKLKPFAIYTAVVGLLFDIWTGYAVAVTWKHNHLIANAVFGDFGFSFVMFLVANVLVLGIWCLVDLAML
jgi:hypothetical protein